uniref:Uncharacterized protein n=1 Tax=Eutreptiella gymnastica TaxID=73025 RepID=A0A7S4CFM7_9EUGL
MKHGEGFTWGVAGEHSEEMSQLEYSEYWVTGWARLVKTHSAIGQHDFLTLNTSPPKICRSHSQVTSSAAVEQTRHRQPNPTHPIFLISLALAHALPTHAPGLWNVAYPYLPFNSPLAVTKE